MLPRRRRAGSTSDAGESSILLEASDKTSVYHHQTPTPTEVMSSRDRTREFIATVKSMQERMNNGYMGPPPNAANQRKMQLHHEWRDFSSLAKKIGGDISNTFVKLEKLTLLAKRRTLFDDKPLEIQDLTHIIKDDISNLNREIAHLQELAKARKSRQTKHLQSHSNSVVVSLQSKLATMSNDFRQVLEVRTENLKHQKNRREQFSQGALVASSLPPSALSGHHSGGSALMSMDHTAVDLGDSPTSPLLMRQDQLQLIDEQDAYIQSRADTMQNIEATIVELGTIFQQLAHMVKEQEEVVQRIDANVEDTSLNVEAAHSEISRYFQSVTSNRWLMIKIFGVLIVFFIIFVVIAAA